MTRRRTAGLFLFALAILVVVADQVTKHAVRTNLPPGASWEIAPWLRPFVQITHVTNTGVAFGMFPGLGIVSAIVSAVITVAIVVFQRQVPPEQRLTRLALGLMLGGAIGNLIDRVTTGSVVDFVDLNFWPLQNFAVFNVADSSVTVGTITLVLRMLWEERQARTTTSRTEGTAAESS